MRKQFWILLCLTMLVTAQPTDEMLPLYQSYSSTDYHGDTQSWDIVQAADGLIYVGNLPGILEYDSRNWRMIPNANGSLVRSLAVDANGRVFAGCSGDFGYLEADSLDKLRFHSLLEFLPENEKGFNYVWSTLSTPEGIYFATMDMLYRFTPNSDGSATPWKVTSWPAERRIMYAFYENNTVFVVEGGIGLKRLNNDKLEMIKGSEFLARDRLQTLLPFSNGSKDLLVGTFGSGLFIYNGRSFKPFRSEADDYLKNNVLYKGVALPNGDFGFCTLSGGFVIISPTGKHVQTLSTDNILPSNTISEAFVDRQGLLWLAADNAIIQVEIATPIRQIRNSNGTLHGMLDAVRHNGTLFFATYDGATYLDEAAGEFKLVSGLPPGNLQSFALLPFDNQLLLASQAGVFRIEKNPAKTVVANPGGLTYAVTFLHRSKQDPDLVYVGLINGLASIRWNKATRTWIDEGRIEGINNYVVFIREEPSGKLWINTDNSLLRVAVDEERQITMETFDERHNLSTNSVPFIYSLNNEVIFVSKQGVMRYDDAQNKFIVDSTLDFPVGNRQLTPKSLVQDDAGTIWIDFGLDKYNLFIEEIGETKSTNQPFMRIRDIGPSLIYPDRDNITWFATADRLYRYDGSVNVDYQQHYNALIRSVTVADDSMIFGGAGVAKQQAVSYSTNALRFDYSAASYVDSKSNLFSTYLEGLDKDWSGWSREGYREYTNLQPGSYAFHVRVRNSYDHASEEAVYPFQIISPWYRTWAAWILYALATTALVFGFVRLRTNHLKERSKELESIVAERTKEIQEQKEDVERLSKIGKTVTASLSVNRIIDTIYENVNNLMDASVFGIGIYNEKTNSIDMSATKERGASLPGFSYQLDDETRPAVYCFNNRKEVFSNDYQAEYSKLFGKDLPEAAAGENPASMIYLPLIYSGKPVGVITAQSFKKNAFTEYNLNILRNMATYAAIALDNARAYRKLDSTLKNLQATQDKLVVQQKLASLGQLTAGIAHEIKNPLNFVNNFSKLSAQVAASLSEDIAELDSHIPKDEMENILEDLANLKQLSEKTIEHGQRADSIVRNMMNHARTGQAEWSDTNVNELLEESINLVYHGMRARVPGFNVTINTDYTEDLSTISLIRQDIGRVFLNIIGNACYAANKRQSEPNDDNGPTIWLKTTERNGAVEIKVRDNGEGIPEKIREQIFTPFFTTKPTGEGTGLGLSISYDTVVKEHDGELLVDSEPGKFTEFTIRLPRKPASE
ncbi:MAG: sensor histidine kinase [Calditrichia bacterium]